jgi:hypothetical protein
MCTPAPSVAGTPDVILETPRSLVPDFVLPMKIFLVLVTVLLGQSISSANDEEGNAVDGIMPEMEARTGEFKVAFTIEELLGETSARQYESIIPADEEVEWEIVVAENYDPDHPAGVLIYVSPSQKGSIPPQWKSLLADYNLIWIGANHSGNRVPVPRRMAFALTAPAVINQSYQIDIERIYLTGFSGGGRVASMLAAEYPDIFKGAIFNCGAEYWGDKVPERLDLIRTNRYVFLTGTYDQALEPTKKAYRGFQRSGVEHSRLMVVPNMTHSNPKRRDFKKAIEFLDLHN